MQSLLLLTDCLAALHLWISELPDSHLSKYRTFSTASMTTSSTGWMSCCRGIGCRLPPSRAVDPHKLRYQWLGYS